MVGICNKIEDGKLFCRRVLISYSKIKNNEGIYYFSKTRFIEKDPYFYDTTKSHQYWFGDATYKLLSCTNENKETYKDNEFVYNERKYHSRVLAYVDIETNSLKPIVFKAKNDEAAIEIFKTRKEYN